MKIPAPLWVGLGVGVVVIGGLWFAGRKVADVAAAVAPKLTPASPENIVYQNIIGGTGRVLSQDANWTLGGWLADWRDRLSGDEARIGKMLEGAPPAGSGGYWY